MTNSTDKQCSIRSNKSNGNHEKCVNDVLLGSEKVFVISKVQTLGPGHSLSMFKS